MIEHVKNILGPYINKKLHCIKIINGKVLTHASSAIFTKGGFYKFELTYTNFDYDITAYEDETEEDYVIFLSLEEFLKYFELATIEEIRKRKIDNILHKK